MVDRRRVILVVGDEWRGIPPDVLAMLLFACDHQRNVYQWHLAGILARGPPRNVRLVVCDIYSRQWPRAYARG